MARPKILIVNDWTDTFTLWTLVLERGGYAVACVADGQAALDFLDERPDDLPDLILMDVNLPDINGLEATARLKASPQLAWIPIIAVTSNAMHGDRERCIAAGCDGYLAKPVMKNELLNTVAMFLQQAGVPATTGYHQ